MKIKNLPIFFLLTISLLVFIVSSCKREEKSGSSPSITNLKEKISANQILRFNLGGEPSTYDPAYASTIDDFNVVIQLFEGLFAFHPESLTYIPALAESWEVSKDGLTYTFKIKKNTKWSDGVTITAKTFYDSWIRALSKEADTEYSYMMFYIKNAKQFHEGQIKAEDVGIKVIDENTLSITLESPVAYFLNILVLPIFMPVPVHKVEKFGKDWTKPENFVCNGPFKIKSVTKEKLVMEKNSEYWDNSNVYLTNIEVSLLSDSQKHYEMYKNGELDWLNGIPNTMIEEILATKNDEFFRVGSLGTEYYALNMRTKVLQNLKVRKALYLSIIRSNLQDVLKALIPSMSFVPKNMPNYEGLPLREDPELARKLLAEAGYPNGKGFPKLKILTVDTEERKKTAEKIKELWKQELNIDVEIEAYERKVYRSMLNDGKYDIGRSSWVGDYVDPSTFLEIFLSDSNQNKTGWTSKKYDELLYKARQEYDSQKRNQLFLKAEEILLDEVAIIPLYNYVNTYMLKYKKVKGIYGNIMDVHPLKNVYIVDN